MPEQNASTGRSAPAWKVCVTYVKTAHGHMAHKAEPVQAVFWPDKAIVLPDGPKYTRNLPEDSYLSYTDPTSGTSWILFESKLQAEEYAERQELYLQIHTMAMRHNTLEKCSTPQLCMLHKILSDPTMALPVDP